MLSPSLLSTWGSSALPEWGDLVKQANVAFEVVWNPIIRRWAVVRADAPPDQILEFNGYGYPGWIYVMTVETEAGGYREPDFSLVAELRRTAETFWRCPSRHLRHRWIRDHIQKAVKARRESDAKVLREANEAAEREVFAPARAGRVTSPTAQRAYGWTR